MSPFRLLRFGLSLAAVSALFAATACGSSDEGGGGGGAGGCEGTAPTCAIASCGGPTQGYSTASCEDGQWECPVSNGLACVADSGDDDASFFCDSDIALYCGTCNGAPIAQECNGNGWFCPPVAPGCGEYDGGGGCPDVQPVCDSCDDGSEIFPVCSGAEWLCPVLNCPFQGDGGYDGGPSPDAGFDSGPDAATDAGFDAGGTICEVGASCEEGQSCTVASPGSVPTSCECIDGLYACTE